MLPKDACTQASKVLTGGKISQFTLAELSAAIHMTPLRPAAGPDEVTYESFANLGATLVAGLLGAFNWVWHTCTILPAWLQAYFITIPKHGKPSAHTRNL